MDWKNFLERHNIHYVDRGPNVGPGHIGVNCPFCARTNNPDPSQHMEINLNKKGWKCWRNKKHRGFNPEFLISALLGISIEQAKEETKGNQTLPKNVLNYVTSKLYKSKDVVEEKPAYLEIPKFYTELRKNHARNTLAKNYLRDRGFQNANDLARRYDLRNPVKGDMRGRIVMPLTLHGEVVGMTGRSISKKAKLRYKSSSFEKPIDGMYAVHTTDQCLYNFDNVFGSDIENLVIVEGPFDVMKLDFFGYEHGMSSVGVFTNSISTFQKILLSELIESCDHLENIYVCLDAKEHSNTIELLADLIYLNTKKLPVNLRKFNAEDPGDLEKQHVVKIAKKLRGIKND